MDDQDVYATPSAQELNEALERIRKNMDGVSRPLAAWFLDAYAHVDDPDSAIVDGSGDMGLDAIYIDPLDDSRLVIVQFKEREDAANAHDTPDQIAAFRDRATRFRDPDFTDRVIAGGEGASSRLIARLKELNISERLRSEAVLDLLYVSFARVSAGIRKEAAEDVTVLDVKDLAAAICESAQDLQRGVGVGSFAFETVPSTITDHIYFGAASAASLALLLDQANASGADIYEYNVRNALNSAINKDIQSTLRDPRQHTMFAAFNNGLTIVAQRAEPTTRDGRHFQLREFGVVNGGQTLDAIRTVSEAVRAGKAPDVDLSQVAVPVKIVVVPEGKDPSELVGLVAARSNNQNKIKQSDLASLDARQSELAHQLQRFGCLYRVKRGRPLTAREKEGWEWVTNKDTAAKLFRACSQSRPQDCHQVQALYKRGEDGIDTFAFPAEDLIHLLRAYAIVHDLLPEAFRGHEVGRGELARMTVLHIYSEYLRQTGSMLAPLTFEQVKEGVQPLGGGDPRAIQEDAMRALLSGVCKATWRSYLDRFAKGEINRNGTTGPREPQSINMYVFKNTDAVIAARAAVLTILEVNETPVPTLDPAY